MVVTTEIHGDVAVVTMDDGKKNAIDPQAITDLHASLDETESAAKAVVLAGRLVAACTGHAFAIGAIWLCARDTRIGARGPFRIGMTETKMGMTLTPWALEPLSRRRCEAVGRMIGIEEGS